MCVGVCVCVIVIVYVHVVAGMCAMLGNFGFFVLTKKQYLGVCDAVGERARTDVCLHVDAGHVIFFLLKSCFPSSSFFFFFF